MGQYYYDVFQSWWKPVKDAIADGTAPASFVRDTLPHGDTKFKGSDEEAMYLTMSVTGAGSDNPRLTLNTFVMAALCHPDEFQKLRNEANRVCGEAQRLPNLDDMSDMPYTCAGLKEVLRWRLVMPLIPQHPLTEDLEFEGFTSPKAQTLYSTMLLSPGISQKLMSLNQTGGWTGKSRTFHMVSGSLVAVGASA